MPRTDPDTRALNQRLFAGGVAPFYLAILAVTILVGISAVMVVSASSGEAVLREATATGGTSATQSAFAEGKNNLAFIIVGALVACVISRLDYRRFASWSFPILLVLIGLLVYLVISGVAIGGAKRWIQIGNFSLQPSELVKPVLLMFTAYVLALFSESQEVKELGGRRATTFLSIPAVLIGITLLTIILQPDLGTTSIIVFGLLIVYIMSGFGLRFLTFLLPIGLGLYLFRAFAFGTYQAQRIQSLLRGLLHGEYSHQVTQSMYALGSGGILGVGLGLSRQKYFYLPEAQNDFILAIIGEEMGLVGTLMVVGAFACLMWAGYAITLGARDRLGRVLSAGATTILIVQAIINMVAVVGIGPVTGKPLPFVTLGGSAMLSSFILLGLILSVARNGGEIREGYGDHRSLFTVCADAIMGAVDGYVGARPPKEAPSQAKMKTTSKKKTKTKTKSKTKTKVPSERDSECERSGGDEDEGDIEWRWDRGTRLSGTRSGR